jgi:hypothetical protein
MVFEIEQRRTEIMTRVPVFIEGRALLRKKFEIAVSGFTPRPPLFWRSRFTEQREPVFRDIPDLSRASDTVYAIIPHLPGDVNPEENEGPVGYCYTGVNVRGGGRR